jgi:hypothetical protein
MPRREACAHHHFHHRVKRTRIGGVIRDNRAQIIFIARKLSATHRRFMALHEVDIAFKRIDFAVMCQQAEWLR